jgi:hypothetical protein
MGSRKKAKPSRSRKKAKPSPDQAVALDYVRAWAHPAASAPPPEPSAADAAGDDFLPHQAARMASGGGGSVLFELHSHSNHSDGFLSPSELVERAHRNGVSTRSGLSSVCLVAGRCLRKCL